MTAKELAQLIRENPGCAIKLGEHDYDWQLLARDTDDLLMRGTDMTDPLDGRLGAGPLRALAEVAGVEVRN